MAAGQGEGVRVSGRGCAVYVALGRGVRRVVPCQGCERER